MHKKLVQQVKELVAEMMAHIDLGFSSGCKESGTEKRAPGRGLQVPRRLKSVAFPKARLDLLAAIKVAAKSTA